MTKLIKSITNWAQREKKTASSYTHVGSKTVKLLEEF